MVSTVVERRRMRTLQIEDADAKRLAVCTNVDEMRAALLLCTTQIEFGRGSSRTAPLSELATASDDLLGKLLPSFQLAGAALTQDGQTNA